MSASTSVQSNASNFGDYLSAGVDPRTGHFMLSLNLPSFIADDLAGPVLPLTLSYNLQDQQNHGFGKGWSLNLSCYNPDNHHVLSVRTGETFRIDERGQADAPARISEKKLDTFHFHADDLDQGPYRIVHKSGEVEHLTQFSTLDGNTAMPSRIVSSLGHGVALRYVADTQTRGLKLEQIVDDRDEVLLSLAYYTDRVVVRLAPQGNTQRTRLDFTLTAEQLTGVEVFDVENATWQFNYEKFHGYDCIVEARTPQGTVEYLAYTDGGHRFPGRPGMVLPRVTSHRLYPGAGMPPIETKWTYSSKNYLGYGGTEFGWENDGTDQLYKVANVDFRYQSVEQLLGPETEEGSQRKVLRMVTRIYNRFHQMVEQRSEQNSHVLTESIAYHTLDNVAFKDQPAYFQQPKFRQLHWSQPGGVRSESSEHHYDSHGNLIWEKGADGMVTEHTYYPPEGEAGDCPAQPNGFANLLKSTRLTPAAQIEGKAPVRETTYRYGSMPPLADSGLPDLQVLMYATTAILEGDTSRVLSIETTCYHNAPDDKLLHGRVHEQLSTVNGITSKIEFNYVLAGQDVDTRAITTETLQWGHTAKRPRRSSGRKHTKADALYSARTLDCLTGDVLQTVNSEGVIQRNAYDTLGRVISESIEGNAPATRRYRYRFAGTSANGQGNETVSIDVNQVELATVADGLARPVTLYRSLVQGERGDRLECHAYNVLGQRVQHTHYDDFARVPAELTSTFEYDDWGTLSRTTGPDGVVTVSQVSLTPLAPAASTSLTWQEHPDLPGQYLGKTFTQYNVFGKVDATERYLDNNQTADRTTFAYDGLGRCIEQTEHLHEFMADGKPCSMATDLRTTTFTYDDWDRVIQTVRPDGSEVLSTFVPFSTEAQVTALRVGRQEAWTLAGEQTFDTLGRVIEQRHGDLTTVLEYAPGSLLVKARTLPSGERLAYEYDASLAPSPTVINSSADTQRFVYHPLTGLVTEGASSNGTTEFEYNLLGEVEKSTLKASGQADHVTCFSRSRQGRRLSRTDTGALDTAHEYDTQGRVKKTTQGLTSTKHGYNTLGQLEHIATRGPTGVVNSTREYDALGRELLRRVKLHGLDKYVMRQAWSDDDMPVQRSFEKNGVLCLEETFQYDLLGRLSYCTYNGDPNSVSSWLPTDRFGDPLASELFEFDDLGNITYVTTTFHGSAFTVWAEHLYDPINLSQLASIRYTTDDPNSSYPPEETFQHTDGCLTRDASGNTLEYDTLGRLTKVTGNSGQSARSYHYDPHDQLLSSTDAAGTATRYFFENYAINHTSVDKGGQQYLYSGDGQAVAQHTLNTPAGTSLLVTDANGSVRTQMDANGLTQTTYDAWGNPAPALSSGLGYNGARHEPELEGYLLGNGYRAYLPRVRRFNTADSASPFDGGGLNPYAYAGGNPIVFHDPTGHYTSRVAGPQRTYLPEPLPEPSWWQRWLPVGIGLAISVGAMILFPPAGMAAWAVSVGSSVASLAWNVAVALEAVKDSMYMGMLLMAVDFGANAVAKRFAKGAQVAVSRATQTADEVVGRATQTAVRRTKPKAISTATQTEEEIGGSMPLFKVGTGGYSRSTSRSNSTSSSSGPSIRSPNLGKPRNPMANGGTYWELKDYRAVSGSKCNNQLIIFS